MHHLDVIVRASIYQHFLYGWASAVLLAGLGAKCVVNILLQFNGRTSPVCSIGSDDQLCFCIIDAITYCF